MLTVVIGSFMVDDMLFLFLGRSKDERVLHSELRRHLEVVGFVKPLETLGSMRLGQVFRGEFIHLATQNRVKKGGKSVSSPPPLALEW